MKRLFSLIIALIMIMSMTACSNESDEPIVPENEDPLTSSEPESEPEEPEEHEHEYYEVDRVEPTETGDGYVIYECECGDWYKEILPATGTGDEEDFEEGSEEDEENP